MNRYNRITNKNKREIVLLKAFPCKWGKCSFCDYTDDNSEDEEGMLCLNEAVLSMVTGEFGVLEVINSGSCFELPQKTLLKIKEVIVEKRIKKLFFESHWIYRKQLKEMEEFMRIPIIYKIGVETFDYHFRQEILNKHADFRKPEEVAAYFDSPCLMVGVQGQTKDMIREDIRILTEKFKLGTINVYTNNTTEIRRDENLVKWFISEYHDLDKNPFVEVLYDNIDFGVGD